MGAALITLDTSGLMSILDRSEPNHHRCREAFEADAGPYLVPAGILAEIGYMVERWLGSHALDALLADLESGGLTLECGENDLPRIRALAQRYLDLPLGLADACVVACAERNAGRVLTLDRDFGVVAREGTITLLPD